MRLKHNKKRNHQFGNKLLSGIFMGYEEHAGGGWAGDLHILDWEELDNASHISQLKLKRLKADEVFPISTSVVPFFSSS